MEGSRRQGEQSARLDHPPPTFFAELFRAAEPSPFPPIPIDAKYIRLDPPPPPPVSQGSSERQISLMVERSECTKALRAAHAALALSDTQVGGGRAASHQKQNHRNTNT